MSTNSSLISLRFFLAACLAVSLLWAATVIGADTTNFSGSYTQTKGPIPVTNGEAPTLQVSQTGASIEVTRVIEGHQTTYDCPLNGGEEKFSRPNGATGTCKARLRAGTLVLEVLVIMHAQPNAPALQIHTKERWELSQDLKALTIKTDIDFPGPVTLGAPMTTRPSHLAKHWTEIYTRN